MKPRRVSTKKRVPKPKTKTASKKGLPPRIPLKKGFKVRPATQRIIKNERPESDTDA